MKKVKILIIDNDKNFKSMMKKFFSEICGYEVESVKKGYDGIIRAKKTKPDIILLDMKMPAMNGIDVLGKLRSDPDTSSIPVVFLTGFYDERTKEKALGMGAALYISKPVELEDLKTKVDSLLP